MQELMSPEVAHRFNWRSAVVCLKSGVDRTWLANCKNVEIDPERTSAVPARGESSSCIKAF